MTRILFFLLLLLHGQIHLLGFLKAFDLAALKELPLTISRQQGLLWAAAETLFSLAAVLFLLKVQALWAVAAAAAVLSQALIFGAWQEAKFGTSANLVIFLVALVAWAGWNYEASYRRDVKNALRNTHAKSEQLSETDVVHLPQPVRRYLNYVGVFGREKVTHFKAVFGGQLRQEKGDWFEIRSEQYNFFTDEPSRLFFIKAVMKGLPVQGYHTFRNGSATMRIKLFSLIPIIDAAGKEMDVSETVTLLNDLCLMAPATLIDPRFHWEEIDDRTAKVYLSINGMTVSAVLMFDEDGRLLNFVSEDRYALSGKTFRRLRWSTPISEYVELNGLRLPGKAEMIYAYPEGDFAYGRFILKDIVYNPED
ncbi:MAG: hypothetical protein ONB24_07250 [candidate division KSB1 bacterium]|nr:hypothetical protein [candidate division KSB1 bacterium]